MSKTKEYSSDVHQKIVEHHKIDSSPHFDHQGNNYKVPIN